ncbi:MAG: autotransporter outer membrane beta-barrel domain-containing protein, partial [Planctomycetaceae bacterium]|nr:autotransporter outer membrane beta-barrel domain-containing protein [Planctomycetaceae bacterium]
ANAGEMSTAAGQFRPSSEDPETGPHGSTVTIKSESLVQAFNGLDGGYTVNNGHTLLGDADSKLDVLGYSTFTGTLTIEDGGTLDTEGKMSVTKGGYLNNSGSIVNRGASSGGNSRGMYFGEGSHYDHGATASFINQSNGFIGIASTMDETGYKTLLESIVNNGTIQLHGVTPTDESGPAGLQDINMSGGGTGRVEIYYSDFAANFNAGNNKLMVQSAGRTDGVQNLTASTVIFDSFSTIQVGLQNPNQVSTINVTGDVQISSGTRIGLTTELKTLLASTDTPQSLGAFLTASGTWDIEWYDEATNLYEVDTSIGTFMVEKSGNELLFSSFNSSLTRDDFVADYWQTQSNADVTGFLRNSTIVPVGTAINSAYTRDQLSNGALDNYDTLSTLVGMGDDNHGYSAAMVESAMSSFSGLSFTNAVGVASSVATSGLTNVNARMGGLRTESMASADTPFAAGSALASPVIGRSPAAANRFWVSGFGSWQDYDAKDGIPGYKYTSGGMMTGYDRWFGPVAVGAAFGFNHGSFKDKAALSNNSDIDNYQVSLYATYNHFSGFFGSVVGSYMYSDYDMKKYRAGVSGGVSVLGWERSDYHANTWMIGTQLGKDFCLTPRVTLTPTIGLYYQNARTSSFAAEFSPDGGGTLSTLDVGRVKSRSLSMPIDLSARFEVLNNGCQSLALTTNVGYAYEFRNKGATGALGFGGLGGAPRIDFKGRKPGRSTWNAGAGVQYAYKNLEFGAKYDYYAKSKYDAHQVMGTVGVNF